MAKRYSVLPSKLLHSSIEDLQFNILVANVGIEAESKAASKANKRSGRR